jgi:hypothetical protein
MERKPCGSITPPVATPPLSHTPRLIRIPTHQQHLQLMRRELLDRPARRPVRKTVCRKTFVQNPKTLPVVDQNFYCGTPSIAEHEQPAAKRIRMQLRPAHPRQAIDAGAKVDARYRHEDAHLRRELDHAPTHPDRHNCKTTSAAAPADISTCSR